MLRNEIYYWLKPAIPPALRRALRQGIARRVRERAATIWPVFPGSERPPQDWPGWPENKRFAFVLTHDVEGHTGLQNCRRLMQLEIEMGFRSSFNFIPEGEYSVPLELRRELTGAGFEVGVHDLRHDGKLYRSRKGFLKKAAQINRYLKEWDASGFRSGFMLHNLNWLHALDICYDMSTFDTDPFEPQPEGYHTIFPFWVSRPRNLLTSRQGLNGHDNGYVELPYTLPQDSTLYLLLRETDAGIWLRKLDWIAEHGGMALVNIHPDYIEFNGGTHTAARYPATRVHELLQYLMEHYSGQFWHPCPAQLAGWFRDLHLTRPPSETAALVSTGFGLRSRRTRRSLQSKRAAVVLYSYFPADPRPRRAARTLVDGGMTVDLICLRRPGEPSREKIDGVSVLRLPLRKKRDSKLTYLSQYTTFLISCFGLLTFRSIKDRYDLVHVHNMPDILVFSALVPKLLGARVILDLHDPMPELMMSIYNVPATHSLVRSLEQLERFSIRFAHLVLTPNEAFCRLFISRGCDREKIRIIMNSPEEDIFDPAKYPSEERPITNGSRPFTLMYHGLIAERHGLDTAVRAIALLKESIPHLQFNIFGNRSSYMDYVDRLVAELDLEGQVCYSSYQPQTEIAKAIAGIDLGVIPNRRSPFTEINMPTRIFEYIAMGKPVIVPDTHGIRDYFDRDSAFFFEPGNVESLAEVIQQVASDPERVASVLANAQLTYREHRWEIQKGRLLEAVSSVLPVAIAA
jgi:glycosyltransferase involved in cell wall biosynthesis